MFALTGRPAFAIGVGLIAAFAFWARGWFLRQWDAQLSARDAGDAGGAPATPAALGRHAVQRDAALRYRGQHSLCQRHGDLIGFASEFCTQPLRKPPMDKHGWIRHRRLT